MMRLCSCVEMYFVLFLRSVQCPVSHGPYRQNQKGANSALGNGPHRENRSLFVWMLEQHNLLSFNIKKDYLVLSTSEFNTNVGQYHEQNDYSALDRLASLLLPCSI